MPDGKYGRIFTEPDVKALMREAMRHAEDESFTVEVRDEIVDQLLGELDTTFPADEPLFVLRGRDVDCVTVALKLIADGVIS